MLRITGTSINLAQCTIYLVKNVNIIILVVPWLYTIEDQQKMLSEGSAAFETRKEQARYVHNLA